MAISNIMSQSLINAKSSMKMARVQSNSKKQMDGKSNVLKAEIKQDMSSGTDVKRKEEELAVTEEKATKIGKSTMNTLSEMNSDLKQAAKADAEIAKAEKAAEKKKAEKAAEKKKAEKKAKAEQQEKLIESAKTKEGENVSDSGSISEVAPSVNIVADGIVPSSAPVETIGAKLDIKA